MLWEQPLHGAARVLKMDGVNVASGTSVALDGRIAFVGNTARHPDELYVMSSVNAKPRRLTDLNAFVDKLQLGRTVPVNWQGPDGFRADGVLT